MSGWLPEAIFLQEGQLPQASFKDDAFSQVSACVKASASAFLPMASSPLKI
jgi:hypothetical protein